MSRKFSSLGRSWLLLHEKLFMFTSFMFQSAQKEMKLIIQEKSSVGNPIWRFVEGSGKDWVFMVGFDLESEECLC